MSYRAKALGASSDPSVFFSTGTTRRKYRKKSLVSSGKKKPQEAHYDEAHLFEDIDTPYGELLKDMDTGVEAKPGRNFLIKYVCPLALLWLLCNKSDRWFWLLQNFAVPPPEMNWVSPAGGPEAEPGARIVLYMDGVVPGNVHRPDPGRAYTSVYWQFLDMPFWMLRNSHLWLDLCCVPKRLMKKLPGGSSHLATLALRMFKGPGDLNFFDTGLLILHNAAGLSLRLRFDFACFLNDADEHYSVCMAKGAQATKPCPCCQNVVGRVAPAELPADGPLLHFSSSDCRRIIPYSPPQLRALIAYLGLQVASGLGKTELSKLFQLAGFNWSPYHLLMSDMAAYANLPDSIYWDWMHTILSSSGVAQYEVNQLIRRIRRLSPGQDIDKSIETFLKQHVVFPKGQRIAFVRNLDLKERVKDKAGKHIRAFANEMILLVMGIGMWCSMFLVPKNLLQDEVRCFELLGRILYILRAGPRAVGKAQLLHRLILQHQDLFVKLYPTEAKPKVHYLLHIPGCLSRFQVNLSCFVTERKHKIGKHIAAYCFRNFQITILRRSLRELFRVVSDRNTLRPNRLAQGRPMSDADMARLSPLYRPTGLPEVSAEMGVSTQASLVHVGQMFKGDVFLVKDGCQLVVGSARRFFMLHPENYDSEVVVECTLLRHEGGIAYSLPEQAEATYVPGSHIFALVPYINCAGRILIVASADIVE